MLILSFSFSILLFIAVLAGVATAAPAHLEVHRGAMTNRMRRHHRHLRIREHGTAQLECENLPFLPRACVPLNNDVPYRLVPRRSRPPSEGARNHPHVQTTVTTLADWQLALRTNDKRERGPSRLFSHILMTHQGGMIPSLAT